jgi:hypothetical protein
MTLSLLSSPCAHPPSQPLMQDVLASLSTIKLRRTNSDEAISPSAPPPPPPQYANLPSPMMAFASLPSVQRPHHAPATPAPPPPSSAPATSGPVYAVPMRTASKNQPDSALYSAVSPTSKSPKASFSIVAPTTAAAAPPLPPPPPSLPPPAPPLPPKSFQASYRNLSRSTPDLASSDDAAFSGSQESLGSRTPPAQRALASTPDRGLGERRPSFDLAEIKEVRLRKVTAPSPPTQTASQASKCACHCGFSARADGRLLSSMFLCPVWCLFLLLLYPLFLFITLTFCRRRVCCGAQAHIQSSQQ